MSENKTSAMLLLKPALTALAVVISAALLSSALRYFVDVRYLHRTVEVTGSATRRITSDRAIWRAEVSARASTMQEAFRTLSASAQRVTTFLRQQGVPEGEQTLGAVETQELTNTVYERDSHGEVLREYAVVTGYALRQTVEVVTGDLTRIQRVADRVTDLLQEGTSVTSQAPEYLYSALGDLKVELIAAATADARRRAEQVATRSGAALGVLERADVGVVQVNAANNTETSWEGMNDRTSREKDAMVTVNVAFRLR